MDIGYARRQMVRQQVRTWNVTDDETLALLGTLKRHEFVPEGFENLAYADARLPLPCGQQMMAPLVEGRLLQALDPTPGERVLEIGTGSGFLAACLGSLAKSVVSVDLHEELVTLAGRNLSQAGVANVDVLQMDATAELPDGPFDVIAVTASMPTFDPRLVEALGDDGRLFVIVGEAPAMEAWLVEKDGDDFRHRVLFETCIAPLVLANRPTDFRF